MRSPESKRFASLVLPTSVAPLRFAVTKGEADDYAAAITGAIEGAAKTLASELKSGVSLDDNVAVRFLRDNSLSKLTGNFAPESVDRLRGAIADAWQAGGGYDEVVKAVQDTFEQFSSVRAGMVARTEVNDAYNEGRDAIARAAGLDEKRWSADGTDACVECQDQIAEGWIPIDDDFPIGDDPPGHVNCDCALDYRSVE